MALIQRLRTTIIDQGSGLGTHRLYRWKVGRYFVTLQRSWTGVKWRPECTRGQRGRDIAAGWLWALTWRGWLLFVWPWSDAIDR